MITFKDCIFRQVKSIPDKWKSDMVEIPSGSIFKNVNFLFEDSDENEIWYYPYYENKLQRIWKKLKEIF